MSAPRETPEPASLLGQVGKTRASFKSLFQAHVGLFKAEIGAIVDQIKQMATYAGVALALALLLANLLYIGGFLFIGEWLFGSIGWGLAHGLLFGVGLIVTMILGIMGARMGSAAGSFALSIVVIVLLSLALGSNVLSNGAANIAGQLAAPLNSPGLVAAIGGALVLALVFALVFARVAGRGGAIGGFIGGAIIGLLVGWIAAGAAWTWPPAVGFAITFGLILWPIFNLALAWPGINLEERFGGLYPRQSIEAVNETKAWLEEQWQTRRPTPGKK